MEREEAPAPAIDAPAIDAPETASEPEVLELEPGPEATAPEPEDGPTAEDGATADDGAAAVEEPGAERL
jgi:hypothetical protein